MYAVNRVPVMDAQLSTVGLPTVASKTCFAAATSSRRSRKLFFLTFGIYVVTKRLPVQVDGALFPVRVGRTTLAATGWRMWAEEDPFMVHCLEAELGLDEIARHGHSTI
jgi:hypothetical protein